MPWHKIKYSLIKTSHLSKGAPFVARFHGLNISLCSKVPAFLNVVDIAGLVKGAHSGQGLGNAFLSHISACDGIFHMTRECRPSHGLDTCNIALRSRKGNIKVDILRQKYYDK